MSNIKFKLDFWEQRQKLQVQVIEDEVYRDDGEDFTYDELIANKLHQGYVIVHQYLHPAVGQVTVFEPDHIFANESLLSVLNVALEPEDPRDYPEEQTGED
jgi:hypothetical protein